MEAQLFSSALKIASHTRDFSFLFDLPTKHLQIPSIGSPKRIILLAVVLYI